MLQMSHFLIYSSTKTVLPSCWGCQNVPIVMVDILLSTHRSNLLDTKYAFMVVHVHVTAFSSLGRGHRFATVLAGVPPKSLPSPHSGQRLSEHQTPPRYVYPRGEPKCSTSQNSKVPLEKHHPCRVSVLPMSVNIGSYTGSTPETFCCSLLPCLLSNLGLLCAE